MILPLNSNKPCICSYLIAIFPLVELCVTVLNESYNYSIAVNFFLQFIITIMQRLNAEYKALILCHCFLSFLWHHLHCVVSHRGPSREGLDVFRILPVFRLGGHCALFAGRLYDHLLFS